MSGNSRKSSESFQNILGRFSAPKIKNVDFSGGMKRGLDQLSGLKSKFAGKGPGGLRETTIFATAQPLSGYGYREYDVGGEPVYVAKRSVSTIFDEAEAVFSETSFDRPEQSNTEFSFEDVTEEPEYEEVHDVETFVEEPEDEIEEVIVEPKLPKMEVEEIADVPADEEPEEIFTTPETGLREVHKPRTPESLFANIMRGGDWEVETHIGPREADSDVAVEKPAYKIGRAHV